MDLKKEFLKPRNLILLVIIIVILVGFLGYRVHLSYEKRLPLQSDVQFVSLDIPLDYKNQIETLKADLAKVDSKPKPKPKVIVEENKSEPIKSTPKPEPIATPKSNITFFEDFREYREGDLMTTWGDNLVIRRHNNQKWLTSQVQGLKVIDFVVSLEGDWTFSFDADIDCGALETVTFYDKVNRPLKIDFTHRGFCYGEMTARLPNGATATTPYRIGDVTRILFEFTYVNNTLKVILNGDVLVSGLLRAYDDNFTRFRLTWGGLWKDSWAYFRNFKAINLSETKKKEEPEIKATLDESTAIPKSTELSGLATTKPAPGATYNPIVFSENFRAYNADRPIESWGSNVRLFDQKDGSKFLCSHLYGKYEVGQRVSFPKNFSLSFTIVNERPGMPTGYIQKGQKTELPVILSDANNKTLKVSLTLYDGVDNYGWIIKLFDGKKWTKEVFYNSKARMNHKFELTYDNDIAKVYMDGNLVLSKALFKGFSQFTEFKVCVWGKFVGYTDFQIKNIA